MAAEWYYAKGKQKHGPLSEAQLQELTASGELLPSDMVWKQGMKAWVKAGSLTGFFPDDGPPPLEDASSEQSSMIQEIKNRVAEHPYLYVGGALGVSVLLTLIVPGFFGAVGLDAIAYLFGIPLLLADIALFVILIVVFMKDANDEVVYAQLHGKWNPVDGKGEPLEFSGGGFYGGATTVTRGNSLSGTVVIHKDKRMEITTGGRVVEVWQLVKVDGSELVLHDAEGVMKRFKKKSSSFFAALFNPERKSNLEGSWQPITESNEWLQFTNDGAVVFSDGSAGKFTVSGEEPNEVIDIELVSGSSRQFKIVSLASDQLVIAEGNEATTFRRPRKAVKKRMQNDAATSDLQDVATIGDDMADSTPTSSSKGVFGGLFSFFTHWKCPKCGKRSAEKISSERVSDVQQGVQTTTDPATNQPRQMVVNFWTVRLTYCCKDCKHQWAEEKQASRIA